MINTFDTTEIQPASKLPSGLYIVATPIGNPLDITLRALEVLKKVDIVACEDTRVTNALLNYHGIKASMMCYNDHSSERERNRLLQRLAEGKSVALVSDAGTPLISDPGYKLLREVQEHGYNVTSLPGASSVIMALTVAGLPTDRFLFAGFLPPKRAARIKVLREFSSFPATMVAFETARRLVDALENISEVYGDNRQVAVCRELTKRYEEIKKGTTTELITYYQEHGAPKGEVVLVIEAGEKVIPGSACADELLRAANVQHRFRQAVQEVTAQTGLPRREVYARALVIRAEEIDDTDTPEA